MNQSKNRTPDPILHDPTISFLSLFFLLAGCFVAFACDSNVIQNQNVKNSMENMSPTPAPISNTAEMSEGDDLLNKARSLQAMGKADEAIALYEKLLTKEHPSQIEIHRSIAEISLGLEKYDQAAKHYRSITDIDPNDARARWGSAKVLIEYLGACKDGLGEAEIAKKAYGRDGQEYVRDRLIGKAYDCLGNKRKAIEFYKRFLKGAAFAPDSGDFKETAKRVFELSR
jgi:tetratricopeptide (TPR) repeat protein